MNFDGLHYHTPPMEIRYNVLPWMPKVLSSLDLIRKGEESARKAAADNNSEVRYLVEKGYVSIIDSTDIPSIVKEPTEREMGAMEAELRNLREPSRGFWF